MKLHSSTHTVEKSGNFEENQFSIEASAKAFMILSDGLYSNKILAVVRELSTNAYKDIVAVPTMSEGGNLKYNYYNLILDLSDIDGLLFKLRSILIIREK